VHRAPEREQLAWAVGGETVVVAIDVEAIEPRQPDHRLSRARSSRQNIFGDNTFLTSHDKPLRLEAGDVARARFEFDLPLLPGNYSIAVAVGRPPTGRRKGGFTMRSSFASNSGIRHSLVGVPMRSIAFICSVLQTRSGSNEQKCR
jgi:lipopolysaccharide transport system ATP-binding protein